ncbi:uncharacterized protein N0V89_003298 [Didymosphaeria variabile]|uniref:DUF7580 domain-containing protein n=1 Tax=Didymosphaeria variabile TaxID=1932322 RepID=A0A9W8XU90_9PLEO|nr:uncharacterized protein N0V89_003298 [Didymosphaeria variabile]KAJ4358714.1 hypothetical protein N0V89_003298 [Didymosphaeria variabile]
MSGIEVAGLIFGIVPVVVEILKSYNSSKERLKSFTHHVQVVYDVQLRYRVAATNFANDCQLLLKPVIGNAHELSQMIDNPSHSGWQDPSFEERLRKYLGRDCQVFEEVVIKIRDVLRATGARLSKVDQDLSAGQNDSRVMSLRQLYTAFDISRKENAYRKSLDDLDQWNTKLGCLRDQRSKLHKHRSRRPDALIRKSVPKRYSDIRTASQRLHDSLKESWSCTNISHVGHQARLSLDAEADHGTAQLDMVIACRRTASIGVSKGESRVPEEPPIWLQVRSITTNEHIAQPALNSPSILGSLSASAHLQPNPLVSIAKASTPASVVRKVKKNLKRVHFDTSAGNITTSNRSPRKSTSLKASEPTSAVTFAMLDLRATASVCCHLSKACRSAPCKDISLGYLESLESPHSFTFIFYDAGRNTEANMAKNMPGKDSYSIRMELAKLHTLHQLVLAHKIATGVLQYHSTSWLCRDWGLEDISYFTNTTSVTKNQSSGLEDQITKTLQTLHLSTQFPSESSPAKFSPSSDPDELSYVYGIRNLTLAGLGVALLEIGIKQELGSVSLDSSVPIPHRIIGARKMLRGEPPSLKMLGKRYIKMARQCIDCDFSSGEDLTDEALRSAVYTDVVCGLEDMITDWKRFMGS